MDGFEKWLSDFDQIAKNTKPLEPLIGYDQWIDKVMAKFRTYYLPLIPDIVSTFPGGVSALRAAIFDRIRKECLAERDIERGRKIILHPLLVASIDNNESFMPMTFTLASDKNAAIYTEGSFQWVLSISVEKTPHGFVTCPRPGCLIGSYTYPDNVKKHV